MRLEDDRAGSDKVLGAFLNSGYTRELEDYLSQGQVLSDVFSRRFILAAT